MSKNTSGNGLLVNYRFYVEFLEQSASGPIYFQKISGLNVRVETETVYSGGENDCVYQLPTTFKYNNLILEKGLVFNPSSYSRTYKNQFSNAQAINSSGAEANYQYTEPEQLKLELVIDGTNIYKTVSGQTGTSVQDRIESFLNHTVRMQGGIHQPAFLKIEWGNLHFDCMLDEVNITYTLFDRSGYPLRARLDANFIFDIPVEKRLKVENKQSPDLTHCVVFTDDSNLPLLAQKMYGEPSLYLQIAKINNLDNFRAIKPGVKLIFPPIRNNITERIL